MAIGAGVVQFGEAAEVASGAEVAAGAAEHDRAHLGISGGSIQRLGERVAQRGVDRVAALGPIEGQPQHAGVPLLSSALSIIA